MSSPDEVGAPEGGSDPRERAAADQRFDALVRRLGIGAFRAGADAAFLDANANVLAMLGYCDVEALRALDVTHDLYGDALEFARVQSHAAASDFGDWVETRWKRRDGSLLTVRVALRALLDERGALREYEGVVEDVTERVRRDELLRRSERMASLGTTLAGVAHELNNPLAAIMGFAQLLLRRPWPEEERGALETISHEAERSAKIVRDLLTLARKRESDERAPLSLNDVVGYILRTRRYAMDTYGIGCDMRLDPGLPLVRGDRAQLEQVVLNLVTNAEQALRNSSDAATDARASSLPGISVRTWREGEQVLLEVSDNGPGIVAGTEGRIWDPFFTTREVGDGTGLGLTVVHNIVTDHGGTIDAENPAEGGARFLIRLPAVLASSGSAAPTAARALDVLVIDANPTDLSFITRFLTSRGHAVLASGDVRRALSLAARLAFDAIVCEVGLALRHPELLERSHTLAADERPRVVVSGDAPDGRPLPAGAVPIAKPFDIEALRRAVEER